MGFLFLRVLVCNRNGVAARNEINLLSLLFCKEKTYNIILNVIFKNDDKSSAFLQL